MSLINDALKRAKQAQHQQPISPPPVPPLRHVETAGRGRSGPGLVVFLAILLLTALLGLVLWQLLRPANRQELSASSDIHSATGAGPPEATSQPLPLGADGAARRPYQTVPPAASQPLPLGTDGAARRPYQAAAPAAISSTSAPAASLAADSNANAATTNPPASTNAATLPPQPPPLPKLHGIFYRPDRPAALLNNKTVFVGDRVGEFDIVAIGPQSVTVVRAGQTNVLNLPE